VLSLSRKDSLCAFNADDQERSLILNSHKPQALYLIKKFLMFWMSDGPQVSGIGKCLSELQFGFNLFQRHTKPIVFVNMWFYML
jgi:hypothetical protein